MALDIKKFIKGLLIKNDADITKELEINVGSGATTGTKTTVTVAQTANRTITLPNATDTLVGKTTTDTLTNKTLTSPVINTPSGIVKGDVGLGNVDNTSDTTKYAAAVVLTNKTISGANNTITNVSLTTGVTGVLPLANGGTNKNMTAVAGGVVWTDSDSMEVISAGTSGDILKSNGSSAPTWLTTLPIANGGTNGSSTPTAGGVAYGNGTAYVFTVAGTSGDILKSNGTGSAPTWITTIPIANGGTNGSSTPTAGGIAYGTGTAYAITAAGTTGYFVTSAGASAPTFTAAANGTWSPTIAFGGNTDSSSINQAYYTRQGNIVNFAVSINVDPTAASAVTIRLTLPIASAFSDPSDCVGSIGVIATAGSSISKGAVNADAANDQINISFIPSGTGGDIYYVHGMYIIK